MKLIPEHAESLKGVMNYIERYKSAARCKAKPTYEEIMDSLKEPRDITIYVGMKGYELFKQMML